MITGYAGKAYSVKLLNYSNAQIAPHELTRGEVSTKKERFVQEKSLA